MSALVVQNLVGMMMIAFGADRKRGILLQSGMPNSSVKFSSLLGNTKSQTKESGQMDHLKMCPKCSGYMYPISERKSGFSGGKAVAGAILAGPIGIAAGALGKRKVLYQCERCGYTLET